METTELINFINDFTEKNVKIYKPENTKKYAAYHLYNGEIQPGQKYGVYFDNILQFDFITGKNEDNFFKCFVNQYINKYQSKQMIFENGELIYPTKKQCIEKLKNSERVKKSMLYTTLYGIGIFCFFMSEKTLRIYDKTVSDFLKNKNIDFNNEFSEAGWVYRFVIKKDIEIHNKLLKELEI